MTPRCKSKDKKLSDEYKRGDVEFVPLTQNELEAEEQAKKIKGKIITNTKTTILLL